MQHWRHLWPFKGKHKIHENDEKQTQSVLKITNTIHYFKMLHKGNYSEKRKNFLTEGMWMLKDLCCTYTISQYMFRILFSLIIKMTRQCASLTFTARLSSCTPFVAVICWIHFLWFLFLFFLCVCRVISGPDFTKTASSYAIWSYILFVAVSSFPLWRVALAFSQLPTRSLCFSTTMCPSLHNMSLWHAMFQVSTLFKLKVAHNRGWAACLLHPFAGHSLVLKNEPC